VLDSVKAIAAGVAHAGDVWELFTGQARIESALPVFAILTLAATGSEMNCSAVVTNDETQEKFFITAPAVFPKLSIVNPRLMQSVSREYLCIPRPMSSRTPSRPISPRRCIPACNRGWSRR
jgi:alcohol dehydrogenase YqhD (iron-dependent ADH family)